MEASIVTSNKYLYLGGHIRNIYILILLSLSFGTVPDENGNTRNNENKLPPIKAKYTENSKMKEHPDVSYSHFDSRECEHQIVDEIPYNHVGSNLGFSDIIGNPSGDVVYLLSLEQITMIKISLCSEFTNFDGFLRVFDGCPDNEGVTELTYNDDGPVCEVDSANYEPSLIENLMLNQGDFYIVVEGYSDNEGNYGLSIEYEEVEDCSGNLYPASVMGLLNDGNCDDGSDFGPNFNCCEWVYDYTDCYPTECEGTNITSIPFYETGSNYCLPNLTGNPAGDQLYKLDIDETVRIDISLCSDSTNFDVYLRVFDGCPISDNAIQLAYNDDGPICEIDTAPYEPSLISNLELDPGEYYIVIDGYGASEGNFGINIEYTVFEDCVGTEFSYPALNQFGDGNCNDGSDGSPNFNCPEWNFDGGDCEGNGPDLVVDRDYLINTIYMDSIYVNEGDCYIDEGCVGGDGLRRIMRFGTLIGNLGTSDFILGTPGGLNWNWDACHGHYHYEEYAFYQLFTLEGEELEIGFKSGWCVMDLAEFIDPPEEGCNTYNCSNQGISVGCADIYHSGLDCQWLDLTEIPDGIYIFKITTNPDEILYEINYHNNTAQTVIQVEGNEIQILDIYPETCLELGLNLDCSEHCFDDVYFEWIGDGFCDDDGMFGLDFNCAEWEFDGADCLGLAPGDANEDGMVNVLDVIILIGFILENELPGDNQFITLDLNNDNVLNILDIVLLVEIILTG